MKDIRNRYREMVAQVPQPIKDEIDLSFAISNRIDTLMKERGLSKKQFADALGKRPGEVTRWLSGQHNFTISTLAMLLLFRQIYNLRVIMANESLSAAKAAKNDEFYTQYYDIEREISAYLEYNPDVFRGKTVLLPCDDPEWSNFTLYFAQHFQTLGLKKLISTSYAPESKKYKTPYQPSLFEQDAPQFDPAKTSIRGKIFVLDHDIDGDGRIDFHDLE